jgi:hypothetical protein
MAQDRNPSFQRSCLQGGQYPEHLQLLPGVGPGTAASFWIGLPGVLHTEEPKSRGCKVFPADADIAYFRSVRDVQNEIEPNAELKAAIEACDAQTKKSYQTVIKFIKSDDYKLLLRIRGADLRAKPLTFLRHHFGKSAAWYQAIAHGEDDRPVVADRHRKSSGSETTFNAT